MRNSAKPKTISSSIVLCALLVAWGFFAMPAFAEDATSTPPDGAQIIAATTTEGETAPQADASAVNASTTDSQTATATEGDLSSAPAPAATSTESSALLAEPVTASESVSPPPVQESAPGSQPAPAPVSSSAAVEPPPSSEPPPSEPPAPAVEPVVPVARDGHAFDPATAPSKVRLKILNADGSVPMIPVFVTFVGVGGRTYGGPIDREGGIATIMPTGRYYTDILVLDTKSGPPSDPPSFFLEANEERDFGALVLTDKSSFTDSALEAEVSSVLESKGGFAKIFSLIVKLLLAILKELRGLRSELLGR